MAMFNSYFKLLVLPFSHFFADLRWVEDGNFYSFELARDFEPFVRCPRDPQGSFLMTHSNIASYNLWSMMMALWLNSFEHIFRRFIARTACNDPLARRSYCAEFEGWYTVLDIFWLWWWWWWWWWWLLSWFASLLLQYKPDIEIV